MTKKINYSAKISSLSKVVSENKIIYLILFFAFLLRLPTLFEPLLNDRETYLVTYAADLLPKGVHLSFIELPLAIFIKLAFFLFGQTFWSVKFLLLIYFLASFFILTLVLKKLFGERNLPLASLLFALIFSLPYFGTNQVGLTLYFPPILICALILIKRYRLVSQANNHLLLILPVLIGFLMLLTTQTSLTASYYQSFFKYSASKISDDPRADEKYLESFGNDVRQSYSLAAIIKRKTSAKESIFIASKQTSIYFLADRKAASKNILVEQFKDFDKILTDIEVQKPVYILYDKNIGQLGELDRLLNKSYNLFAQENNVKIYFRKPT